MYNPFISIIIPVFNREHTICRCINSVLNSSFKDIEILIIDNGSTDGTKNILNNYSSHYSYIKVFDTNKNGVSVARNIGLKEAKGEYIAFVDSDDYICESIYEKCNNILIQHKPDILCYNYAVKFEGQKETYPTPLNLIPKNSLLDRKYITEKILPYTVNLEQSTDFSLDTFVWRKIYKRSIITENNICFDETRTQWEDKLFQVAFLKYAQSYYEITDVGYFYVQGNSNFLTFNEECIELVLRGSKDYEDIVGDMYDFNTPFSYLFYCKLLNNTMLKQLSYKGATKEKVMKCINYILNSDYAHSLFLRFTPNNKFETNIKKAILNNNHLLLYKTYTKEAKKQNKSNKPSFIKRLLEYGMRKFKISK